MTLCRFSTILIAAVLPQADIKQHQEVNYAQHRFRLTPERRGHNVKLITAVIRPEMLTPVKEALFAVGVTGITITRVSGHGGEKEMLEQVRGRGYVIEFHEKVQLSIAVSDDFVDPTIDAIVKAARTGEVGDGKIFVQPIERAVRIRTGEEDGAAVTPVAHKDTQKVAVKK